jgi:plasmid stabilization system protein ParE
LAFHVRYRRRAERDLEKLTQTTTLEWFDGLVDAIESLAEFPQRCAFAPDRGFRHREIRQLLYGERHSVYRILYRVEDENVQILTIRHARRQLLQR